jgi:hypothetical protein
LGVVTAGVILVGRLERSEIEVVDVLDAPPKDDFVTPPEAEDDLEMPPKELFVWAAETSVDNARAKNKKSDAIVFMWFLRMFKGPLL